MGIRKIMILSIFVAVGLILVLSLMTLTGLTAPAQASLLPYRITTIPIESCACVDGFPGGVGVNTKTHMIYVTHVLTNTVSVINGSTNMVVSTVGVGSIPAGIAVNSNTNEIYVTNNNGTNVTVIDGATNTVTKTIPTGEHPEFVVLNPNTNKIYVLSTFGSSMGISVIDGKTNTVTSKISFNVFAVDGIGVNPSANKIYASQANNTVVVIDGNTNKKVGMINVGSCPRGSVANPNTNQIYVSRLCNTSWMTVINGSTNNVVSQIPLRDAVSDMGVDPNSNMIYVAGFNYGITILNGSSNNVINTIPFNTHLYGVGVDSERNKIYVTNSDGYNLYAVEVGALFPGPTSTSVSSNPAAGTVGISTTFSAVVTDTTSGTPTSPTGTVSWSDNSAGGTFSSPTCTLAAASGTSSTCTISYTPSKSGQIWITATYSGDTTNAGGSGTSALAVTIRATKTTVTPNPATATIGTGITLHAKILDSSLGTKSIPTGTVSWSDGGAGGSFNATSCTLAQYSTSTSTSICAIAYTPPANAGPVTITGTYSGDNTHSTSSGTSALTVTLRATKDTISQKTAAPIVDVVTNFDVKVLDSSSGTKSIPTGTVSWSDGGAGGSFTTASCTLTQFGTSTSTSVCTIAYTAHNAGPVTITGTYSGDGTHKTSSGALTLTISLRATTTTVLPSPATTGLGEPITLYAKVLDSSVGTKSIPTGTVSWSDGGAGGSFNATSCTLAQFGTSTSTGRCAIVYSPPANAGTFTITATFSGDAIHKTSSGISKLTVTTDPTSTTITPKPATVSNSVDFVTFHVTVVDTNPGTQTTPAGLVIWKSSDLSVPISPDSCTLAPVAGSTNTSACDFTDKYGANDSCVVFSETITATYAGDSTHLKSSDTTPLSITCP